MTTKPPEEWQREVDALRAERDEAMKYAGDKRARDWLARWFGE